jgi:uncharacterized membrane protein
MRVPPPSERPPERHPIGSRLWVRLLLLVPFIATLSVGFYNRLTPTLFGIPLFYWYQLLWIPLGTVFIGIVYWYEHAK